MGIALFVLAALFFFGILAFLFAIVSIPLLIAAALVIGAVRFALFVLFLPFRLIGWMFALALGRPRRPAVGI